MTEQEQQPSKMNWLQHILLELRNELFRIENHLSSLFTTAVLFILVGLIGMILTTDFMQLLLIGNEKGVGWFQQSLAYAMFFGGVFLLLFVNNRDPEALATVRKFFETIFETKTPEVTIDQHVITIGKVSVAYHLAPDIFLALHQANISRSEHENRHDSLRRSEGPINQIPRTSWHRNRCC